MASVTELVPVVGVADSPWDDHQGKAATRRWEAGPESAVRKAAAALSAGTAPSRAASP